MESRAGLEKSLDQDLRKGRNCPSGPDTYQARLVSGHHARLSAVALQLLSGLTPAHVPPALSAAYARVHVVAG